MSDKKGVKKEETNWFIQLITLGDRFDSQDFFDRFTVCFNKADGIISFKPHHKK